MKKICFIIFFFVSFYLKAQIEKKSLIVDVHAGYGFVQPLATYAVKGGYAFTIEPKFKIKNNYEIGLKLGINGMKRSDNDNLVPVNNFSIILEKYKRSGIGNDFAFFYGGSIGAFKGGFHNDNYQKSDYHDFLGRRSLGGSIRTGIELGAYRVLTELQIRRQTPLLNVSVGYSFGNK